jgi:tetratricopeptide (TPR) repeat protein
MRRLWKPLLIAGLISLTHLTPAAAGLVEDRKVCDGQGPAEPQAQACSRLIASGRYKGRDLAVTYNNRAFALLMTKDFSRAVADYDMAIQLVPTLEDAWFGRGRAFGASGEHQRAVADFTRAIELKPNLARSYILRGEAYSAMGDHQRGLADFDQAIRLEPGNHPFAYHSRGAILRRMGSFDAAIASHDQGLRIDPVGVYGFASRAYAFTEKGDHDRALRDADEALRLDAKSAYAFLVRGLIWSRKGNPARAITDFDESIRLAPQEARAYVWRGLAYEKTGDAFRAWSDFDDALKVTGSRREDREQAQAIARERIAALDEARRQHASRLAAASSTAPQYATAPSAAAPQYTPPVAAPQTAAAPQPQLAAVAQPQGRRVALVIGNSEYRGVPFLPNPRRDSAAVADALRRTGFNSVQLANDLTREQMIDRLKKFAVESDGADWSLVYFAGHGIEVGGQNFVIPVDAKLTADRDVQFEAVQLEQVMAATDGAKRLRLLLLDACRENPYANQMKRMVASRSINSGLAQVDSDAGMLVVFAAKHGQVAYDGQGENSPFVSALIRRMLTPQLEIRKLFDLVRDDVMAATGRRQQPFSYGSVPGNEDFYFTR